MDLKNCILMHYDAVSCDKFAPLNGQKRQF